MKKNNNHKFYILDKDGTLVDLYHRRHYVNSGNRDWNAFFDATDKDEIIWPVANMFINLVNQGHHVEIWSAAVESSRAKSVKSLMPIVPFIDWENLPWYKRGDMSQFLKRMRKDADYTPDYLLKEQWLLEEIEKGNTPDMVFDDRLTVVQRCWRKNGITCAQVAPYFDMNIITEESYNRPRVPVLNIMIGPSGSGKSTYIQNNFDLSKVDVISSDDVRQKQFPVDGDKWCSDAAYDMSGLNATHGAVRDKAKASLEAGIDVVIDSTNIKARDRKKILANLGASEGLYYVKYHIVDRSLEDKLESYREFVSEHGDNGRTSEEIIKRHHDKFQASKKHALKGDGFEFVEVIESDL